MKKIYLLFLLVAINSFATTPVSFQWAENEKMPVRVARAFHGFVGNNFLVAGGSSFENDEKIYTDKIYSRDPSGSWQLLGSLNRARAEGVSCTVNLGEQTFLFCAGGTNGKDVFKDSFLISRDGKIVRSLPEIPESVTMGGAVADNSTIYVVGATKLWKLQKDSSAWEDLGVIPGVKRAQVVASIQNGDQKEKILTIFGGFDIATKMPLSDGFGYTLTTKKWKKLSSLPPEITTIGSAFLPCGNQHILLFGGFGWHGWIARAINSSQEVDPLKLGWQRDIFAYNAVTDVWCKYGELNSNDIPRCGAAAGLLPGKIAEEFTIILAGGEEAPRLRTDLVSKASFRKDAKFGGKAWFVVGVYALLMVAMACFFIFKKKNENDYFRGGNRIPWYVAGMSIFATMLSSITFIAIPTQAFLSDWRYFPMAICIFAIAPVAIFYYLPFFCRLGITSAYEYLEKRFNLGVRLFGSAAFVIFMICRVAVVTLLPAIALNAVTGISIDACILICGVLTIVYCSLGGLEAVIWSDFIQGIVLLGGALAVLIVLIMKTGGDGAHMSTFWSVAVERGKNTMWDLRFVFSEPVLWVVLVQGIVANLSSYTSDQCVIQRYIATPDENATKRSIWFNGAMSVFASVIFYGIGTALFTHYHTNPTLMDVTMPKSDSVFPIFMAVELPWWLAGLVIAAIFAATISTLSANLSSASTATVTDFIKRFNQNISGKAQIRCGQICTCIVGVLGILAALVLARVESRALFDNFQEFIAMLTAGLTGLFFMGVFMPRVKGGAAVIGLVANYVVCFVCKIYGCNVFGFTFHPFLLGGIGLVVCVLVAVIFSFILRENGKNLTGLTLKTLKK